MTRLLRRFWLGRLEASIKRIERKQNRLSKRKAEAMIFAANHRKKLSA